eukprot:7491525-Pyramimonas_sp.AAC.1
MMVNVVRGMSPVVYERGTSRHNGVQRCTLTFRGIALRIVFGGGGSEIAQQWAWMESSTAGHCMA